MPVGNRPKLWKILLFLCFSVFLLFPACQEGKEKKDDYSGVSDLISERNRVRYRKADKKPPDIADSKNPEENGDPATQDPGSKEEEEVLSIVLYEEKVDIIASESKQTLAKGVAYINKKGQIVRIKIIKE